MTLQELDAHHESAFLAMIADYQENDPEIYKKYYLRKAWSPKEFRAFVQECQKQRLDWRPKGKDVSVSRYVLVDSDGQICGNGILRFPLTEDTEYEGGNVFFDVPPSKRGSGCGMWVLNGLLFEAARAGMARLFVTCFSDQLAAIRAIERNRGELQDEVPSKLETAKDRKVSRFWIRLR